MTLLSSDNNSHSSGSDTEPETNLPDRHRRGKVWEVIFKVSTVFGMIMLVIMLVNIVNDAFGYVALSYKVDPASLTETGSPIKELGKDELITILENNLRKARFKTLEKEMPFEIRTLDNLQSLIIDEILKPEVKQTWNLWESMVNKAEILNIAQVKYPGSKVEFRSWLSETFITSPQSSQPLLAGVRTAILGSLLVIVITIVVAFPIGIGASIYLQEYAKNYWFNRLIQTNINNLAGVPSIIYGMLGLAIFVRLGAGLTSGAILGYTKGDPSSGRTILSAGLTMALLILPVIIINGQEAIKAIPNSLREASYGIGATKWQTVWYHILPNAISGILTGTILAISRAFGETAPLVIVGAATYITFDPDGIFSRFTTLPIQIYQWTSRAQAEFHNLAAAAILVLITLLLALNAVAIYLRNRFSQRY